MDILSSHSSELREFVQQVQTRAQLDSYNEAYQLSHATLKALGQAISGGEARKLAGWLPPELGSDIEDQTGHATAFDKANFLEKVGAEIYSVDTEQVEHQVTAALHVVGATAPPGELDDTVAALPRELSAMFG